MPKKRPELVGEPIGWDKKRLMNQDGSEITIKEAFSIKDLCELEGSREQDHLLCFTYLKDYGPLVVYLQIVDGKLVKLSRATVNDIRHNTVSSTIFFSKIPFISHEKGVQEVIRFI